MNLNNSSQMSFCNNKSSKHIRNPLDKLKKYSIDNICNICNSIIDNSYQEESVLSCKICHIKIHSYCLTLLNKGRKYYNDKKFIVWSNSLFSKSQQFKCEKCSFSQSNSVLSSKINCALCFQTGYLIQMKLRLIPYGANMIFKQYEDKWIHFYCLLLKIRVMMKIDSDKSRNNMNMNSNQQENCSYCGYLKRNKGIVLCCFEENCFEKSHISCYFSRFIVSSHIDIGFYYKNIYNKDYDLFDFSLLDIEKLHFYCKYHIGLVKQKIDVIYIDQDENVLDLNENHSIDKDQKNPESIINTTYSKPIISNLSLNNNQLLLHNNLYSKSNSQGYSHSQYNLNYDNKYNTMKNKERPKSNFLLNSNIKNMKHMNMHMNEDEHSNINKINNQIASPLFVSMNIKDSFIINDHNLNSNSNFMNDDENNINTYKIPIYQRLFDKYSDISRQDSMLIFNKENEEKEEKVSSIGNYFNTTNNNLYSNNNLNNSSTFIHKNPNGNTTQNEEKSEMTRKIKNPSQNFVTTIYNIRKKKNSYFINNKHYSDIDKCQSTCCINMKNKQKETINSSNYIKERNSLSNKTVNINSSCRINQSEANFIINNNVNEIFIKKGNFLIEKQKEMLIESNQEENKKDKFEIITLPDIVYKGKKNKRKKRRKQRILKRLLNKLKVLFYKDIINKNNGEKSIISAENIKKLFDLNEKLNFFYEIRLKK